MKSPELVHANFREFLQVMLPDINAGGRANCATLIAIDHVMCNLTHLVFVYPKNYIYRCKPDFWGPVQDAFDWLSQASALLDGGGLMKKEFKALGIRKSDVPLWLLQFHGSDDYSNPKKDLGFRCSSVLVPSHQVPSAYQFLCRWFEQLSEHMFVQCSEEEALAGSQLNLPYGTDYDLLCFPLLREKIFGRWHGENGLLSRLWKKVAALEAGAARQLVMPPFYLSLTASLSSGREIFFGKHNKDFLDAHAFENGNLNCPVNLETLDLIYCLQCRLIRLLDWPQFFVNAKEKLEKEQAFTARHPMTAGLPYDPYVELSEYLASQRQKYPILEESPYTSDAFLQPPIVK
jgi:hypothetical protein